MQAYLKDKKNFISDMSNIPCLEEHSKIIDNLASYLQKKLNLISCIANLCYAIGI